MEDATKILQNMDAYRQGYQEGRANVIQGFQKVLERICLDIDEIKEHLIPKPKESEVKKGSKSLDKKGQTITEKWCDECSNLLTKEETECGDLDGLCHACYSKYVDKEM